MTEDIEKNRERFDHANEERAVFRADRGLSEEVVEEISRQKDEPEWMTKRRLKAFRHFQQRDMPDWGPDLSELDIDEITPYLKADDTKSDDWDEIPDDIKDTFDRLGIPEAEQEALSGVGAQYECLAGDSNVFTNPEGPIEIQDIEPGSKVFAIDPETKEVERRKVLAKKSSGVKEIFRVKVKGGREIKSSGNHPFLVLDSKVKSGNERRTWFTKWKPLAEIEEEDYVAVSKDIPIKAEDYQLASPEVENPERCKEVDIPEETSEDLMWLFGFYLGDGFVKYERTDKKRVSIAVDESQEELRKELVTVAEKIFDIKVSETSSSRLSIFSTRIAQFFIDNGFEGRADEKSVPDWVFGIPDEQRLAFLAGYLDADGTVRANEKNKDPVITSNNEELLKEVQDLALYTGLNTSSIHQFSSDHPHNNEEEITAYRLQLSGDTSRLPSRHPVKKQRLGEKEYHHNFSSAEGSDISSHCSENIGFSRVKNIESCGEAETFDIQVEGRSNFICDGVVVHNSEVVYQNMKEEWEEKGVIFCDMDEAVQEHEDLVREYFMTKCVPPQDNKFAALHGAVWSGGSFVYVPEGVEVEIPVQAYFRMNSRGMGQFEHTLIIAEENSKVHYIEGCHPEGTMVGTSKGEKAIEDIDEGESVLTHEGRFRDVKETQERIHRGHIYDIEFWGDSTRNLTLTPGHPILISRRERDRESNWNWNTQWTEAKDVEEKDYMVIPRREFGNKDQVNFPIKKWDNSIREFNIVEKKFPAEKGFFRLIGYYLAEGSNSGGHYLNFSFNADEEELLKDTEKLIERYFEKEPDRYPHKENNGTTIRLNSTDAVRIFEEFGERAGEKTIPEWVHDFSQENIAEMLKGFFRGDGNWYSEECKHGDKSLYRFNTVSEQLARKTRNLLLDLGIGSFINLRKQEEPRQDIYTVGITGQHMEKFCEKILGEEFMDDEKRRQSKIHFKNGKVFVPIKDIRKRETEEPVYNLKVEEDESYVSEGVAVHNCSAPTFGRHNLHSGCVEVYVGQGAHVQYSTVQNWSKNTYNLNTKRALVEEEGTMEWVSGSMGSKVTMLYPSSHLNGEGAKASHISIAYAGEDQNIDTGAKVIHNAPNTSSTIESKSISQNGGRTNYRGLLRVAEGAENSSASVECDALMFDDESTSDTEPFVEIKEDDVDIAHEATVGKLSDEAIYYLMSRGIEEEEAQEMIIRGFIEPIAKELPLEYAVELNRLIQLEMEGSLG